jgi:2,3-bisphosphoglycerate-dependent phosphoglycerate mutase
MAKLILIRHGQSTWNSANKFTGWVDVPLNHQGLAEAERAAQKLKHYSIDICFTSLLIRSIPTKRFRCFRLRRWTSDFTAICRG